MYKDFVTVTKPTLPPLDEFIKYLESIWESRWVTNMCKYHKEFEKALAE